MRYLFDTSMFLWVALGDPRANQARMQPLLGSDNTLLSIVSPWEIAIKSATGRLALPQPAETFVPAQIAAQGIALQPIELEHVLAVASLPLHHRDPFDRLLVAQARQLGATIVTTDPAIARYDVPVLDPRVEPTA